MEAMNRSKLIRILCIALVSAVLALALILLVAVCGGDTATPEGEETTRRSFYPSLPDEPLDPGEISDIIATGDWGDLTKDPDITLPPEPEDTLPDWESGMEWPTLPPSLGTDPDFEMPTIPEEWETLPEEWSTLPPEWGDIPYDPDDLADLWAGMNGMTSMGAGAGALAAGVASQLTVMEIYAEKTDTLYLKMQSFGAYNGQGWEEAGMYGGAIDVTGYSANYLPHFLMNEITPFAGYPLTITPKMDIRVIPYYVVADGDMNQLQTSDVKALGAYDQTYTLYYRPYALHAYAPLASASLAAYEEAYREFVYRGYLEIDETTLAYMKLIIEEQGFDKNDPDIVEKVAAYIQNAATYNLAYNQNLDREPNVALAFLGAYKEGVCRHYATAATLLYRALGIPARYTVGFMADVTAGETTAVKGADAHAWVEVYEEGFGWRYVEVTGAPAEGDPSTPPDSETETDTVRGTEGDTDPADEPVTSPTTWGDLIAGSNGSLTFSPSIPPAMLNNTVFSLYCDSNLRTLLKLKSFGDFTGDGFAEATPCGDLLYETFSAAYLPGGYLVGRGVAYQMTIHSPVGTYAVPYYISSLAPPDGLTVWDHMVTGDGRTTYNVAGYTYGNDYSAKPVYNLVLNTVYEFAQANYLTLDEETRAYLELLIAEQGWTKDSVDDVAEYLRAGYVLGMDYNLEETYAGNAVLGFLKGEIRGNSRHFAAAATLIYRALGIPARYTVGYLSHTDRDEQVNVLGRDAYAWTEIFVRGFGWMPVDVAQRGADPSDSFTITLKPVDMALPYTGETQEHSGLLEGFEAFAAKGYTYQATVSGRRSQCGVSVVTITSVKICDSRGQDVTALFKIEKKSGSLTVYLEELILRSQDQIKVYDGLPLKTHAVDVLSGSLPDGYRLEIIPAEEGQTLVGAGYAAYDVVIWYDRRDGRAVDRTEWFLISKQYGTHTVTPAALTVKADDALKTYDGIPLTADGITITGGTLAEGDYIDSYTVEGSQTRVGRSDNVITEIVIRNQKGEDVTGCYAIELLAGTLRVTSP